MFLLCVLSQTENCSEDDTWEPEANVGMLDACKDFLEERDKERAERQKKKKQETERKLNDMAAARAKLTKPVGEKESKSGGEPKKKVRLWFLSKTFDRFQVLTSF